MIKNPKINGVPLEKWLESLSPEGVDSVTLPLPEIPEALKLLGEMWKEHKQLRRFIQEDLGYTLRGWRQSEGKPKKPKQKEEEYFGYLGDVDGVWVDE